MSKLFAMSLLLFFLSATGCGGSKGTTISKARPEPGHITDTATNTNTPNTSPTSPNLVDIYHWTKVAVPDVAETGNIIGLYLSGNKLNLYLMADNGLFYKTWPAGVWEQIKYLDGIPQKKATYRANMESRLGRDLLSTSTGLVISDADKKLFILQGKKVEWGINVHQHNLHKSGTDWNNFIDKMHVAYLMNQLKLGTIRNQEYVSFGNVKFMHRTDDEFDSACTEIGYPFIEKSFLFNTSAINVSNKNEMNDDGSAVVAAKLLNAYELDSESILIHVKDQGIFIRKKVQGTPRL